MMKANRVPAQRNCAWIHPPPRSCNERTNRRPGCTLESEERIECQRNQLDCLRCWRKTEELQGHQEQQWSIFRDQVTVCEKAQDSWIGSNVNTDEGRDIQEAEGRV
ncbi:uncharacterized protein [Oryctolagus cuniculus]|uniref:uncharacterized protein n=1 Tax=Oryctolagus cuniculus TaxID=9986 RepID=UPI003879E296